MSKNFELLQRVAKDEFFNLPEEPVPPACLLKAAAPAIPFKKEPPDAEITKLVQRLFSQAGKASGPKVSFFFRNRARRPKQLDLRASGEALAEHVGRFGLYR